MTDPVQAAIRRVRAKFLAEAGTRTEPLHEVLSGTRALGDDEVLDVTHKIAGLAGSLGLPAISDAARRLEGCLRADSASPPADESRAAIRALLAAFDAAKRAEAAA
jgi:HPt (histidine-containing phosphotransfer) domain-containing protein